jgi:hypothetical protein
MLNSIRESFFFFFFFFAGTRSACINAATLALADAGIPLRDLVTSCSSGYLNTTPLLGKLHAFCFSLAFLVHLKFLLSK